MKALRFLCYSLLPALWVPTLAVHAQPASIEAQRAFALLQEGRYAQAQQAYEALVAADSTAFPAWLGLGMCLKQLGRHDASLQPFARAFALDSTRTPALYLYLGDAYMFSLDYARAAQAYSQFLKFGAEFRDQKAHARQNLRKAQWARAALADSIAFRPQALGAAVNGPGEDYNAFLTADDSLLYFNSHRAGNTGGGPLPGVYHGFGSDFYSCTRQDSGWSQAQNLGQPLNSALHEKEFHLSPDGRTLLFGRHPLRPGQQGYDCGIWTSTRGPQGWEAPTKLEGDVSSPYCDSWPALTADGSTLYFVSDRPGGFGGYDIWRTHRLPGGSWGPAENLGPTLNSPGDEFDVFLHPDDSTLYFSSDYHPGFGGFDIFLSRKLPSGKWDTPQNLGYPLNTPWDEFDFFVNASGTTGYMNSDRWGGQGLQDLYAFTLDARIRPRPTYWLKGQVTDDRSNARVPEATLLLLSLAGQDTTRVLHVGTHTGGHFLTALPRGGGYALLVVAQDYLPHSGHYAATQQTSGWLPIALTPLVPDATFSLRNIFFDTDRATLRPQSTAELQVLLHWLRLHPAVRLEVQGHTDSQGTPAHNDTLSLQRATTVRDYLLAHGVAPQRLTAVGMGQRQPLAPNDTADGRQLNRSVRFRVLAK
jgi:outer membrane protein OmpA-like peptidoglycan-associated protein